MIKILIADDHLIVREGLKQILSETPDIRVMAEASDGMEVLKKARSADCDVIILDISMPLKNGLEVLKDLKNERPEAAILVLSIHPEERFALRVLKSGASGYLTKSSAAEELVQAIRDVAHGKRYITKSLAEKLAFGLIEDRDSPLHEQLSEREYQVMIRIGQGKSLKFIAEELFISLKTVSTYRTRIMEKMKMTTNAEIIRYCIEHKLVD
jgi:two-component system invasion response regulator UvrY